MDNQPNPAEAKRVHAPITIDNFINTVELRTAKVLAAVPVEKKDKLYQLTLEVGNETRTIVSGIRPWYSPEELVGKTIAIVANLEPKKLGGIMSQGMLLAALDDEGKFSLLVAEKPVKSGAEVR
jgi:methionyl-tRNA synthetase